MKSSSLVPSPLVIGHRGARGYEPENTIESLRAAISLGASWVEVDVRAVHGELLVFHDERLERTTNGVGRLEDLSIEELRRLDAGKGARIPLLAEVLDEIEGRAGLNIEMKGRYVPALLVPLLKERTASGRWKREDLLISSFDHRELYDLERLASNLPRGALMYGMPLSLAACATAVKADTVVADYRFVDSDFIDDARERGLKIFVYTVNDVEEIGGMISYGVDGIISDYPDRVLKAWEAR